MRVWRGAFLAAVFASASAGAEAGELTPEDVVSRLGLDGFVLVERLPEPAEPRLAAGRAIWAENCMACHGGEKLTGAPKITSTKAWSPRVEKGLETLFNHAKGGFMGPRFTEMPPRGGNPDLTDAEVESAVAFMVWASGGRTEVDAWLLTEKDQ